MEIQIKSLFYLSLILSFKRVVSHTCDTHESCDNCIRDPSVCVWCAALDAKYARCMPAIADTTWCSDNLKSPESSAIATSNLNFNSAFGSLIQLQPQTIDLQLRPGQLLPFQFFYKGVQDYPVDLYFLFDASNSMVSIRNHTAQQAKNIYDTMRNMTSNVYMGLGSFVDKNTLPYTVDVVKHSSYSFRHHLKLGKDYTKFQDAVMNITNGENRDLPEGTLDALAQTIACKDQIDWRTESRKIVVLLTDGYYHTAGDGKSGGIFTPYDGECYTKDGIYTKELEMDYPSVSMINKLVRDYKVIVIFVVSKENKSVYESLSKVVTGSKVLLLDNKDNYADMVPKLKEIYQDITRKIKLNVDVKSPGRPNHFEIQFSPDCTQESESCVVTGKENNYKQFNVSIKLLKYDNFDKTEIGITIDGIDAMLTLNVNVIESCDCEPEYNSDHCNKDTLQCGTCMCTEPRFGDRCQCTRNTLTTKDDTSACLYNATGQVCNGHGTCSCGICSCNKGFVGQYCQCLQSACPLHDGVPCGGHGTCQCDRTCACDKDYSGSACECFQSDLYCTGSDQKVCNNRGNCTCGTCSCNNIDVNWDKRKTFDAYCIIDPCPECHKQQCETLSPCALCLLKEEQDCPCPENYSFRIVDRLSETSGESGWHVCSNVRMDVGCYTNYTYMYEEQVYGIRLLLQKEKDCAMSYYLFGGVFLLSLLLIGILTLVGWKLCTYYGDKQEYKRFVHDHKSEISPCDNPLYLPPKTCFRNPAFRKPSNY